MDMHRWRRALAFYPFPGRCESFFSTCAIAFHGDGSSRIASRFRNVNGELSGISGSLAYLHRACLGQMLGRGQNVRG